MTNKKFYVSVWRWHLFAGLYVIPFILMLSITGLIMLANPWIDPWQYGDELTTVEPTEQALPLEQQLRVAAIKNLPALERLLRPIF